MLYSIDSLPRAVCILAGFCVRIQFQTFKMNRAKHLIENCSLSYYD